eukprot:5924403-Amphidinium_carterae.1
MSGGTVSCRFQLCMANHSVHLLCANAAFCAVCMGGEVPHPSNPSPEIHVDVQRVQDTCSLVVIMIPCVAASILLAKDFTDGVGLLWAFSQFLEGFAMVPQYIFCYRDRGARDVGIM